MARKVIKTLPLGRVGEFTPPHPERTARKAQPGWDGQMQYIQFPSREEMAKAIRREERDGIGLGWTSGLRPVVRLAEGEGY